MIFLGKHNDARCETAARLFREAFPEADVLLWRRGETFPDRLRQWGGGVLVSYLTHWIVPADILARATVAVNFHPAPPEYPGTGCVNFALYDGASAYGVTCHHMHAVVDSGPIIEVRRFSVHADDTVATLLDRSYYELLRLFEDVLPALAGQQPMPVSTERWTRAPFQRYELDDLARIEATMGADEVARRVRATTFGA